MNVIDVTKMDLGTAPHIYRMLMRPPAPGALPRDGLIRVDYNCGYSPKTRHHYWGTAEYKRKLTKEELDNYEMEEA